jgi:creatinine amidohydrolase
MSGESEPLRLERLRSPEVAAAIAARPLAVLPVGSVEQHGPHLPTGTDTFAAEAIAAGLATKLGGVLAPFVDYGVTPLHRGRPGTVSLRPATFEALLRDIGSELLAGGFEALVLVNWHEGNTPSLNRVATELQGEWPGSSLIVAQACYVAQRIYADDGGELTHGGGIETLAVLATDPELVELDGVEATGRDERGRAVDAMRRSPEVYGFLTDVGESDPAGWYGDPHWADPARAAEFVPAMADAIAPAVERVLELRKNIEQEDVNE